MDQCQTTDDHRPTMSTGDETHTIPDHSELVQESYASSGETLPRAPSPDQIQQSAELEPFIMPAKPAESLSSATQVSPSAPSTLVPEKAKSLFRVWMLEVASLLLSFSCFICKFKATMPFPLSLTCLVSQRSDHSRTRPF